MNFARRPRLRWSIAAGLLLVIIAMASLGSGVGSALWSGRSTQNAYLAFGQTEWIRAADAPLDPIARAELEFADESLPDQVRGRPRVHPPGTLVTLDYEALGDNGVTLDRWSVRAIVPMLGDGGELDAEVWNVRLPDEEARLARDGGRMLRSSGATGLPAEAILRLPVGAAIEIGTPDLLTTTDLLDGSSHVVRRRAFSWATGPVTAPARVRAKLIDACAADVRVGRKTELEFASFAPVPIPIGFEERRWVQMTGCDPRTVQTDMPTRPVIVSAPSPGSEGSPLLDIGRDGSVYVDEGSEARNRAVWYRIETICQFDVQQDRWQILHRSTPTDEGVELPPREGESAPPQRVVARLPPIALYWLRWSDRLVGSNADAPMRSHESFGFVGGMLCNDVDLGPAPNGQVATCVPFSNRSEARFVPDPASTCAAP